LSGFGHQPFGHHPFGHTDWAHIVLWDELEERVREEDFEAGGWFYKFISALMPMFNNLITLISRYQDWVVDPRTTRKDLLKRLANNFGVVLDLSEPEDYQRMAIEIAGRLRFIKGWRESYEILCRIHGFEVDVKELWWDGEKYTENPPRVTNEVIGTI